jgi:hypothetical protein
VTPDSKQIQISPSSRGITDHFFCHSCDEYVWDCDHLIEERLTATRIEAPEGSQLQCFAYDGKSRVLEIEFRVTAPFIHGEIPLHRLRRESFSTSKCRDIPSPNSSGAKRDGGRRYPGRTVSEHDTGARRCGRSAESLVLITCMRLETYGGFSSGST